MFSSKHVAVCLRSGAICLLASVFLAFSSVAGAGMLIIGGTPPTTATVGSAYSFQPSASVPSGLTATFKIYNKPSWATFSSSTGRLSGTPATVGTYRYVQIAVSDGQTTSWLPSYTITVSTGSSSSSPSTSTGTQLSISGSPPTSVVAGTAYSYQPKTTVPSGMSVTYKIYNKPSWATFSSSTGRLYGTPASTNVGTYRYVQIAASDGAQTAWSPSYTITVTGAAPASTGTATLSWLPPTQNTDGSTLTNLAGYNIYYGTSATNLSNVVKLTNPGLSSYVLSSLSATTWYFAMAAVNTSGVIGPRSSVVSHLVQ